MNLKYEDFLCAVQAELTQKLGDSAQIEMHKVRKNNDVELDGLSIREKECPVAPTIYLNGLYEEYQSGKGIADIADTITGIYERSRVKDRIDLTDYVDYDKVRSHLACKLINLDRNRELLRHIPYVPFLNLAIVIYYRVSHPVMGSGSILVTEDHLEDWKISCEEVYQEARKNMPRILPERFENIGEILSMNPGYELPQEEIPMYVLTNAECFYGAACIIYDSILTEIGEILEDDFWIIPSSIHECIIMPKKTDITKEEIEAMIYQVNCENVAQEEYLSDSLYWYQRDLHKLTMVQN